mmetsp:Transcript_20665/g.71476  ORF Transcript_20665/g.71476 Transcript_20665/m.71476 type:complete len:459 (-) Transcript_20665:172-1548(-)
MNSQDAPLGCVHDLTELLEVCPNCPNGQRCPLGWLPLPRLSAPPDAETYLREFAVPRTPFVVSGNCARAWGWPAADGRWRDIGYFAEHRQVRAMDAQARRGQGIRLISFNVFKRQDAVHREAKTEWVSRGSSRKFTLRSALLLLKVRAKRRFHARRKAEALYLSAWPYDGEDWSSGAAGESAGVYGLGLDIGPGVAFAKCLLCSELGKVHPLPRRLRWIYIGEPGTGSAPHVDPLSTHAWMWQAAGRKEWRIVRRDPVADAFPALGASSPPGAPLDMFGPTVCDALATWAQSVRPWQSLEAESWKLDSDGLTDGLTAWAGELKPGELLFVPAGTLHAVRNAAGTGPSVAVSHNYVDAANVLGALRCLERALGALLDELGQACPRDQCKDHQISVCLALEHLESILSIHEHGLLVATLSDAALPGRLAARAALSDRAAAEAIAAMCLERQTQALGTAEI